MPRGPGDRPSRTYPTTRTGHVRDSPLTGHVMDMPKSMRLTQLGHDPARGSHRFKRLKVLTTAKFYEAQPHIAAGFHAWHFNGNLKACVGWRGGAICIVSDGITDGSLIRKSKSNGRQTRAKLLGHLSARPGPEARVGCLATVSGLHLEAMPSLLNLGLCRAFAACPCLC